MTKLDSLPLIYKNRKMQPLDFNKYHHESNLFKQMTKISLNKIKLVKKMKQKNFDFIFV